MARLIFFLLIGVLVWGYWRQRQRSAAPPPPSAPGAEAMRQCAECGLHLPDSLALPGKGGHYCCAEHRQRHEARLGS